MFIGFLRASTVRSFGRSLDSNSKVPIKCLTLNDQPCQARLTPIDVNANETIFYPIFVNVNKCGGSCNNNKSK